MAQPILLGMRGTGSWSEDERPTTYRQAMLRLYPNGSMPLTGISSMLSSESTDDPEFNWWTKNLPKQYGQITEIYDDPDLSSASTGALAAGAVVYVQLAEEVIKEIRPGHTVLLRKRDDYRHDTRGKVLQVVHGGSSSFFAMQLLEAVSGTYDLSGITDIKVNGNMNAEGATMPEAISYGPEKFYNYTQIFRTSLSITRTAQRTRLRTGDQYKEMKREALELHGIELEQALLWGQRYEGIGSNGKPERATRGLITTIVEEASDNVSAYHVDTNYSGSTWTAGGEDWIDTMLEKMFRYGSGEKMAFGGSGIPLALKKLAKAGSTYHIESGEIAYGIRVVRWITPYGDIYFKTHPLFSHDPATRNDMVIFEPRNVRTRYIDDTFFVKDPEDRRNRNHSKDGREEEFITELGLEVHHPSTAGYLSGFGLDNGLGG